MASRSKDISVDFFQARCDSTDDIFPDILKSIMKLSAANRIWENEGRSFRLTYWSEAATYWSGVFVRFKEHPTIKLIRQNDDTLNDMPVIDGTRFGEMMCFCYFPKTNTVAVHNNRSAGAYTALVDYIKDYSDLADFDFAVMLNPDAWAQIEKMETIREIEVKLAIPTNSLSAFDRSDRSTKELAKTAVNNRAEYVKIVMSSGYSRNGMEKENTMGYISGLLKLGNRPEKLEVRGNDGYNTYPVNLIENRIKGKISVSYNGAYIQKEDIFNGIYDCYENNRRSIEAQYRVASK